MSRRDTPEAAVEFIGLLSPNELYVLKEALSKLLVFGPWTKQDEGCCKRPEPGRTLADSRAFVWHCSGYGDLAAGWYYRIGFGVAGIGGITGTIAHESADGCMKTVDAVLSRVPDLYLVQANGG